MSSVSETLLSPQEYLARERKAEFKSEYYRGEMFALPRTNWNHATVKCNAAFEAANQLQQTEYAVVTSDMRVKVEAEVAYVYPDIIVCGKPRFEDGLRDTLLNLRVLMEILSDSTEKYDRGTKAGHYRRIPSLQEYVLIAQDQPLVERYVRQMDDGWLLTEIRGLEQTFACASIPVKIALAEIYRGVKFHENVGR